MRYALTFEIGGDNWNNVDTIIIEDERTQDEAGCYWYEDVEKIKEVLVAYGLNAGEAELIIDNSSYFIRHNLDNADVMLDINGEIL